MDRLDEIAKRIEEKGVEGGIVGNMRGACEKYLGGVISESALIVIVELGLEELKMLSDKSLERMVGDVYG